MAKNSTEKFKTMIGGQALIEGIMMRGPEKDATVIRGKDGLEVDVKERKIRPKGSFATWPLIRGPVSFFDAQVVGMKALMHSADLNPEDEEIENPSKLDMWLEKKLGEKSFQNLIIGIAVNSFYSCTAVCIEANHLLRVVGEANIVDIHTEIYARAGGKADI